MTLQTKTTITIVITVCIITLLLYAMLYASIMSEYISMDEELNQQNVERAFTEIDHRLHALKTLTLEWSAWSDTYQYMEGEYPNFIEDNIFDITYSTLNIDYMLFYDIHGNLSHGESYSSDNGHFNDIPKVFHNIFADNAFREERLTSEITGIISTEGQHMLMCALPIQKSDWQGSNGTLIIARYFNDDMIDELNQSLIYPIIPQSSDTLDTYTKKQIQDSVQEEKSIFNDYTKNRSVLETYGIYKDIYDAPSFVFKISSQRKIYEQGKETNEFILFYLTAVGLIIAITGSLVFNKYVIARLVNLTNEVSNITLDGDLERSIRPSSANDEIGILRKSINQMLSAISAKTKALKEAHEALKIAKQEADEASNTKSRFLANMSHEIRTPLNGIMGMTDLTFMTDLTYQQRTYLEMVKYSGNILLNIINDILDISKIEADKLQLENIEFNVKDSIEKLIRLASTQALQKNIEVILDIDPNVPTYVMGDPIRLNQIALNLINNAIKFTEEGEISVTLQSKQISGCQHIEFSINDTGIGIPSHKLNQIFDEFTQADSSITRKYGGTGLGLTISSQLVKAMGGQINVSSQLGKGSTFSFTIPFAASFTKEVDNIYKIFFKNKGILVIVKNIRLRTILSKICRQVDLDCTIVSSYNETLDALERKDYDAMIVDLHMNDMDGLELANKAVHITQGSLPIILLTTPTDMINDKVLMDQLNICNQIIKPVLPSEFISTVHNTMNKVQKHIAQPEPLPLDYLNFENKTILVAEDGVINKKIIVEMLNKFNINVLITDNGADAFQLFKTHDVDLIIMDIEMPIMDGFEATKKIKEACISSNKNIPIIAITAYVLENEIQKCFAAGMDDYMSKPISLDVLCKKLEKYLSPSSQFRPTNYINHTKLDHLVNGEAPFVKDLLISFVNTYPSFIFEAKDCLSKGNIIKCKKALHGLKGTASSLYIEHGLGDIVELEKKMDDLEPEVILKKIELIEVKLCEVGEYIHLTYKDQ